MDVIWMILLILALGYAANELLKWLGDRVTDWKLRREMDELNRDHKDSGDGA